MTFGRYDYATFGTFIAYAAGSVIVPVALVSLARDLGFPLESGGMSAAGALHLGRTATMVATLLLCGFAAGRWGKRRIFGLAVALVGLAIALCASAPSYGVLFLALVLAGCGEGVIEGIATPFVQGLHPDEPGRYINFSHSFWSVGVLVTVLFAGGLISLGISWRLLIGVVSALSLVAAAMLLLPESPSCRYPERPDPTRMGETWGQAMAICRNRSFWLFFAAMFVAGGGEFCLTFWCASYIRLNFVDSAWAGGIGTACFAGGMVLGRSGWGYLIKQHQLKYLIFWSAIAGALITLPVPWLGNLYVLFAFLFLAGIATAPMWPSVQSYCADRIPGSDTTMLFILLSSAGVPGCGFFTWLMGCVGNQAGDLSVAFYLVPGCYLTLAALIGYEWWGSAVKEKNLYPSQDACPD